MVVTLEGGSVYDIANHTGSMVPLEQKQTQLVLFLKKSSKRTKKMKAYPVVVLCLLLLLATVVIPTAAAAEQEHRVLGTWEFLKVIIRGLLFAANDTSSSADDNDSSTRQASEKKKEPVLIIGAGLWRTGTSSFVAAMDRVGVKSYHMSRGVMETPGHAELWAKHSELVLSNHHGNIGLVDEIIDRMAMDGFNATADGPSCIIFKELMDRYPNAKVVLTVKSKGGEAWAESVQNTIDRIIMMFDHIPWRWIPLISSVKAINAFCDFTIGAALPQQQQNGDIKNKPSDQKTLTASYNAWVEHVKTTVPEEKLLVFQPEDGWAPLCEFISPLSPAIEDACQKVLLSGESYPNVNDTAHFRRTLTVLSVITCLFEYAPPLLLLVFAVCFVIWRKGQLDKSKKE
jgi:Sulfotransferase domain